ncbi:MAG: FAD-binding protein, partial [Hyphomicrobiales bacterium]|nr:FAD-binding protein [Hyphomicrobiales bacterium]
MTAHAATIDVGPLRESLRGRLEAAVPLAPITWFRVGGPAEWLFTPADEDDLATMLAALPATVPVTVIGLASNLLVRDGGIPGLVVKLGRGFNGISVEPGNRIRVGAAVPDARLATAATEAGIAGLAFYRGIPGGIGGALRMNAGCYGSETRDRLIEARAVDRRGNVHLLQNADFGYAYRHSSAP